MELRPRTNRKQLVPGRRRRRTDCSINLHLLWLVFLRLPLKSLFRCKAVCKLFNSIVSDPLFVADYRRRPPRTPSGEPVCPGAFLSMKAYPRHSLDYRVRFISGSGKKSCDVPSEYELSYTYYPRHSSQRRRHSRFGVPPFFKNIIIASSGSVLLCSGQQYIPNSNVTRTRHYVVNPLTKEWRTLPKSPLECSHALIGFVCREEVQSGTGIFQYEYEVVRIQNGRMLNGEGAPLSTVTNIVETYISRSDMWSAVSIPSQVMWSSYKVCMIAVRGVFYWIYRENVIAYNRATSKFEEFPLPVAGDTRLSIGEGSNGALILYVTDSHGFDVWERGSDKQKPHPWWRKHRVEWMDMVPQSLSTGAQEVFMSTCFWYVKAFPGHPDKVLLEGLSDVLSYELRNKKLKVLYRGELLYVMHECCCYPYDLPSWHFQL